MEGGAFYRPKKSRESVLYAKELESRISAKPRGTGFEANNPRMLEELTRREK